MSQMLEKRAVSWSMSKQYGAHCDTVNVHSCLVFCLLSFFLPEGEPTEAGQFHNPLF